MEWEHDCGGCIWYLSLCESVINRSLVEQCILLSLLNVTLLWQTNIKCFKEIDHYSFDCIEKLDEQLPMTVS